MPYIITTKTRNRSGDWLARLVIRFESRRAVGTLDEAIDVASKAVYAAEESVNGALNDFRDAAELLEESGGTVGPLPDGTVVEVEPTEWGELVHAGRLDRDADDEQLIIDAYNAAQED